MTGNVAQETKIDRAIGWTLIVALAALPLIWLPDVEPGIGLLKTAYLFPKAAWLRLTSILLVLLLGSRFISRRRISFRPDRLDVLLFSFATLLVISAALGLDRRQSLYGGTISLEGLVTYLNYFFLFLLARAYASTQLINQLTKAFLLVTGVLSFLVIVEVKTGFWVGPSSPGRLAMATLGNGVMLAGFLTLVLPLLLAGLLWRRYQGFWQYLSWPALGLAIAALLATQGAVVIGINTIVLLAIAVWSYKLKSDLWPWRQLALVVLTTAVVVLLPATTDAGGQPSGPAPAHLISWSDRQLIWKQTLDIMPRYVFVGAGLDNYGPALSKGRPPETQILPAEKPFSLFLEIMVTGNAPALVAYLLFWISWLAYVLKGLRRSGPQDTATIVGLTGSILGCLAFMGLFFSTIGTGPIFFAFAGLAAGLAKQVD